MDIRAATLALLASSIPAFTADSSANPEVRRADGMERLVTLLDLDERS